MARKPPHDDARGMSSQPQTGDAGDAGATTTSSRPPRPRLYRSTTDRWIGGVAGGLADYFGVDPVIVRVAFAVLGLVGGGGVVAYVLLWVLLPEDDGTRAIVHARRHDPALWGGLALLVFGILAVFDRVWDPGDDAWHVFWPLVLIGAGVAILVGRANPPVPATEPGLEPPPGPPAAEAAAAAEAPFAAASDAAGAPSPGGAPAAVALADTDTTRSAWPHPGAWPAGPPPRPPRPHRPRPKHPPSPLGPVTLSAVLLFLGVASLVGVTEAAEVDPAVVASIALMIVGGGLLVGARYGRARGLIALGIVGTVVAGALVAIDVPVRGGVGERVYRPTNEADVRDEYRLGIGKLHVDLTDVPWSPGEHDVDVRLGVGEAKLFVPRGVGVVVDGHVGLGTADLDGRQTDGVDVDDVLRLAAVEGRPTLVIDAEVGIGSLVVESDAAAGLPPLDERRERILR
jgi:phage shock protein PspC (stress-responsive transcriptional regulator)